MDALTLLKDDHQKMRKLLSELESTTERGVKTREDLYARIKSELTVHEIIEEEIFYPALKDHPKAKDIVLEAYEEHTSSTPSWPSSKTSRWTMRPGVRRRR
jgi:hypothetical protein